ncbi:MAG: potassium transporter TrkG, partial [Acidobacteriota bacterium]
GIRGERAICAILDLPQIATANRLIIFIVMSALLLEGGGTVLLTYAYAMHGSGFFEALWRGTFHSISAFCNAGFALQRDSVSMFQNQPWVLLVLAALITLGGLGFAVLGSAWFRLTGGRIRSLAVQVRMVLLASAVLVLAGTAGYAAAEWRHTLDGLRPMDKAVNALFQSVTLRTAGFNSIDFANLQPVSLLGMLVFMFVGASPGSTGGGIKTTTALVLLGAVAAIARGDTKVTIFRHTMPLETVYRSAAIAVITILVILTGCGALLSSHDSSFPEIVFEVFSAIGTVGLSLGATAKLNFIGKLIITAIMLLGRIGPLTLALLLGRERRSRIGYPEAGIMIG